MATRLMMSVGVVVGVLAPSNAASFAADADAAECLTSLIRAAAAAVAAAIQEHYSGGPAAAIQLQSRNTTLAQLLLL
ncbi:hypothetical protein ACLOJK_022895 [Asimina triloba]